jgi:DNA-binding NtrC family response regulator
MAIASQEISGSVSVGDHLCCLSESRESGLALGVAFAKAGLDRNERCAYVLGETSTEGLVRAFSDVGVAAQPLMDAGQLLVLTGDEFHREGGQFDVDHMLGTFREFVAQAQQDGYAGVRVVGEMTWALRHAVPLARLTEMEAKVNPLILSIPLTGLCIYQADRFPAETLTDVIRTHPLVMLHDRVVRNVEFVPPEEYLGATSGADAPRRQLRKIAGTPGARAAGRRMLGASPETREVLAVIDRVAPTDSSVLITGETGTGKELVAQAIHDRSPRRNEPFVKVNCAAVPEHLLEVELFGHERGAFTDAHEQRPGRFELADGGTLMLDEVGEMPPKMQAKLLRVLQEREFERVGSADSIEVDIRVLALTNQNLLDPDKAPAFRRDLYYRLNVIGIEMPPLRERPEDIPILADAFLRRACEDIPRHIQGIDKEAMDLLLQYHWPGNVRELENAIERAVVLTQKGELCAADFAFLHHGGRPSTLASLDEVEAEHIGRVLRAVGGNRTRAAKTLGIHRDTLYRKLRQYSITGS